MNDAFAEVRAALHESPSTYAWTRLCHAIDHAHEQVLDPGAREAIVRYCIDHLRRWDEDLLVAPTTWLGRALDGKPAWGLRLTRRVSIMGAGIDASALARVLSEPDCANLRKLSITNFRDSHVALLPEVLAAALADQLDDVTLEVTNVHADELVEVLSRAPRALRKSGGVRLSGRPEADLSELTSHWSAACIGELRLDRMTWQLEFENILSSPHLANIHTLDLSHTVIDTQAAQRLAASPIRPRTLHVMFGTHHDSDILTDGEFEDEGPNVMTCRRLAPLLRGVVSLHTRNLTHEGAREIREHAHALRNVSSDFGESWLGNVMTKGRAPEYVRANHAGHRLVLTETDLSELRELRLIESDLDEADHDALADALALERVVMCNPRDLEALARHEMPSLRELTITPQTFFEVPSAEAYHAALEAIASAPWFTRLEALRVRDQFKQDIQPFLDVFAHADLSGLRHLVLYRLNLHGANLLPFFSSPMPHLHSLWLTSTALDPDDPHQLGPLTSAHTAHLTDLNLSAGSAASVADRFHRGGFESVRTLTSDRLRTPGTLASMLSSMHDLHTIRLSMCRLGPEDVRALARRPLRNVVIRQSRIDAKALARALDSPWGAGLENLRLDYCIGFDGAELGDAINRSRHLSPRLRSLANLSLTLPTYD